MRTTSIAIFVALVPVVLAAIAPATARSSSLPDPMRPPSASERASVAQRAVSTAISAASTAPWMLQGIVGHARERLAIVNGRLVARGERIGAARVISIDADSIRLEQGRRSWLLRLPGSAESAVAPASSRNPSRKRRT